MKKLLTALFFTFSLCGAEAQVIHNDVFWDTADGTPIYSQGGGVFRFIDPETNEMAYFWYGSHFYEAEQYRKDPSVTLEISLRTHFRWKGKGGIPCRWKTACSVSRR